MNELRFDERFSDALKAQFVLSVERTARSGNRHRFLPWGTRKVRKMGIGFKIALAGSVVAGAAAAVIAFAPAPDDDFQDASRIIESLSRPQQKMDKLPAGALATLDGMGIDPSQTRLLGHGETLTYYGAPAEGDKICMIPVNSQGEGRTMGCTLLKSFESGGLGIETPDQTEEAWLVVPVAADKALESVRSEDGWTQQAPNFLVRNNH